MNLDEFAFLNRQLAEMLRAGLPLEGSLRQLAATLRDGALREELRQLEADLARGTPLPEALARRRFPDLFSRLVRLGAAGHDLPGLLTLLADYYQRRHALATRLQALVFYPATVLVAAVALSLFFVWFYHTLQRTVVTVPPSWRLEEPPAPLLLLWLPALGLLGLGAGALVLGLVPAARRWLRWKLPGFREANLAQLAAALHLVLARGTPLDEALALAAELEGASPAGRELVRWRQRLAAGYGRMAEFAAGSRVFPRLFVWLVEQAADLGEGFRRAADLFQARARHRTEVLLHAGLPVAVLCLGTCILAQLTSAWTVLVHFLKQLGLD